MQMEAKQIDKILSSPVGITAFAAEGGDDVATTAITSALTSAGAGGVAVPLQVASDDFSVGVVTGGWLCRLVANATGDKVDDGSGNEVYSRLTEAAGVYTLTYYSDVAGTETAYTFASSTDIDFWFCYQFDLYRYPTKALCLSTTRNVQDDLTGANGSAHSEIRTPTAQDTIPNLTKTPTAGSPVFLVVNGKSEDSLSGGAFTATGKVIAWSAVNAGYNVETTDRVVAFYFTRE